MECHKDFANAATSSFCTVLFFWTGQTKNNGALREAFQYFYFGFKAPVLDQPVVNGEGGLYVGVKSSDNIYTLYYTSSTHFEVHEWNGNIKNTINLGTNNTFTANDYFSFSTDKVNILLYKHSPTTSSFDDTNNPPYYSTRTTNTLIHIFANAIEEDITKGELYKISITSRGVGQKIEGLKR